VVTANRATIYLLEHPDGLCLASLQRIVLSPVTRIHSPHELSDVVHLNQPHCIISGYPTGDPFALLQEMSEHAIRSPLIVISQQIQVDSAIQMIRAGAFSAIKLPTTDDHICTEIEMAIDVSKRLVEDQQELMRLTEKFESLNEDERFVLEKIVEGSGSKQIAHNLDISTRTVDRRKNAIYSKLEVNTLPELILIYLRLNQPMESVLR